MPQNVEPMLATLASKPFSDPDWLFEIKWDGFRVEAVVENGKVRTLDPQPQGRRDLLPAPPLAADLDRRPAGDRRRRGRRHRRRRPPRLLAPPDQARPARRRRARVPGVRPAVSRRPVAPRRPARGPQAPAAERHPRPPAGPLRVARRGRGPGVLRGGQGARPRGDGRQAAAQPLRARPPLERLAQVQDPARAGAGGRRLDAGGGERPDLGALAVGYYEDGKLRFAGKVGAGFTGAGRKELLDRLWPLVAGRPAVRSAATEGLQGPVGRRPRVRDLGPAGARDARRAGRLDARRRRPTGRLQGSRDGPRPEVRPARERGRHDQRGPCCRSCNARDTRSGRRYGHAHAENDCEDDEEAIEGEERPRARRGPRRLARHRRRAGGARRARQGGQLARRRRRAQAHEPRQAAVRRRSAGHQARADRATSRGSRRRCCRTSPTGRSTSSASRTGPARPASGRRTSPRPRRRG